MIDIVFLRNHPDEVRENIRKKFQEKKLPLVDEAIALDEKRRALQTEGDSLHNKVKFGTRRRIHYEI